MVERDIIDGCLRNDARSQEMLYQTFSGLMFAVCQRYSRDDSEAKDLLQEGFLKVFRNLHSFKNKAPLGAWVRRVMVHTCINHINHEDANRFVPLSEDLPDNSLLPDGFSSISFMDFVWLMRHLDPGYRTVFNLHVFEGYSHEEIAYIMRISVGTSKSQLFWARKKLRILFIKHYHSDEGK
jgi:RNA polymerase sigma-70 factor (ECF subfamily)